MNWVVIIMKNLQQVNGDKQLQEKTAMNLKDMKHTENLRVIASDLK